MEKYELFGIQHRFSEEPLLLLERGSGGGHVGIRLSLSQFKALEATSCRCAAATDQGPAALSVAAALGKRALGVAIYLRDLESTLTWLLLDGPDSEAALPVPIDPIDAFALVLRTGLPLMGSDSPMPEEIGRCWSREVLSPVEPLVEGPGPEVPLLFRSLLDSLDLDLHEH